MTDARRSPVRLRVAAALVTAAGLLWPAAAASAGVSVTPDRAVAGDAADITFRITNDRPGTTTTKVRVEFPADAPVAEVYPMSVAGWAPEQTNRPAGRPLKGLHSASVTDVTSAITWVRAAGAPRQAPVEGLRVEMGPVPDVSRIEFTVVQTYSDGAVRRWTGAAAGTVLTVGAPAAGADGSGVAGSGAAGSGGDMNGMDMSGGMSGMDMGGEPVAGNPAGDSVSGDSANGGTALTAGGVSTGNGMIDVLAGILGGVLVTLIAGALITSRIRKDAAREPVSGTKDAGEDVAEAPEKELTAVDGR